MFSLNQRKVLITGATGGIGKAISLALAKQGAHVVLSGTSQSKLDTLKSKMKDSGFLNVDVFEFSLKDGPVHELFDKVESQFGTIDILVNNAGITRDNLLMRMTDEQWDDVININLNSVFKLTRSAVKKMVSRRYGRIINISSVVGVSGNAGQTNYCASKAGMIGFSKALAQEIASRNITVNCIAPGFIATPMTDELPEAIKSKLLESIPCKKLGLPDDIASGVVYLASEEAQYVTGQTLHINGGMLMV